MDIKRGYNGIYRIDKDNYSNPADYYRDINYATSWKFKLFGYLPKDFGTDTNNSWGGLNFYGRPPNAPKPKRWLI